MRYEKNVQSKKFSKNEKSKQIFFSLFGLGKHQQVILLHRMLRDHWKERGNRIVFHGNAKRKNRGGGSCPTNDHREGGGPCPPA